MSRVLTLFRNLLKPKDATDSALTESDNNNNNVHNNNNEDNKYDDNNDENPSLIVLESKEDIDSKISVVAVVEEEQQQEENNNNSPSSNSDNILLRRRSTFWGNSRTSMVVPEAEREVSKSSLDLSSSKLSSSEASAFKFHLRKRNSADDISKFKHLTSSSSSKKDIGGGIIGEDLWSLPQPESDLIQLNSPASHHRRYSKDCLNFEGESLAFGDEVLIKPFGYGVFEGCYDGSMCFIKLPWGTLTAPRSSLSQWLMIEVVSFIDDMPPYQLAMHPNEPLFMMRVKIGGQYELDNSAQFRLAYKGKQIAEEDFQTKTIREFFQNSLNPNVLFILETKPDFVFDQPSEKLQQDIAVSEDKQTVTMQGHRRWTTFKAPKRISRGKHTWKVKLEKCSTGNIALGVCTDGVNQTNWVGGDSKGYGYLGDCSLWENGARSRIYGQICKTGDIIEVHLDMDVRKLSFVKNGHDFGVAFEKLPKAVYPAFSMYEKGDVISVQSYVCSSQHGEKEENYVVKIRTFKRKKLFVNVSRKACGKLQYFAGDVVRIPQWSSEAVVVGVCVDSAEPYDGCLVLYSAQKNGAFLITSNSVNKLSVQQKSSRKINPLKQLETILSKIQCK